MSALVAGFHEKIRSMSEPASGTSPASSLQIPAELAAEIRRVTHDLSNALEVIVQTSYLLGMAGLQPPADEWLRMLDGGVNKALDLNVQLRACIKQFTRSETQPE